MSKRSIEINNEEGDFFDELELEEERRFRKLRHQKKIAWVSVWAMIAFTAMLFMPFVSETRLEVISDIAGLFYIAQAGIIGAFMGASALMENAIDESRSRTRTRRVSR